MKKFKAFIILVAGVLFLIVGTMALQPVAASPQQPRVQAPPPDTCEQAMRENAAYRERIASLERQIDATDETARTFYMRAATWQDAYISAMRLAGEYRNELAVERSRNDELAREIRDLQSRANTRRKP